MSKDGTPKTLREAIENGRLEWRRRQAATLHVDYKGGPVPLETDLIETHVRAFIAQKPTPRNFCKLCGSELIEDRCPDKDCPLIFLRPAHSDRGEEEKG
jgi:hypothetical protein